MTEKRFTLAYADYDWWAICDKENPTERSISDEDVVGLLNELHEENRTLLHIIDWCLTHHREVGHIVFNSRDEFFVWLNEKGVLE